MQPSRLIVFVIVVALHSMLAVLVVLSTDAVRYIADVPMTVQFVSEVAKANEPPRRALPAPTLVQPVLQVTQVPNGSWQVEVPDETSPRRDSSPGPAAPLMAASDAATSSQQPELAVFCPDRTPPAYPAQSRRLREQGEVTLQVTLDEGGGVSQVDIVHSSGFPRLDEVARSTVLSWRCRPAERDGHPVRTVALQTLEFVLRRR